jgi:hypothetical protein
MCKKLRKPFHGKYFINFLKKYPPKPKSSLVHSKDSLIKYAQSLLEAGYLYSVKPNGIFSKF